MGKATQWHRSDPPNGLSVADAYRKYRLIGFIILHSTSHMASYGHWNLSTPPPANLNFGDGYGAKAGVISGYLDNPEFGGTFEGIIKWTLVNYKKMVDATRERFGY